MAINTSTLVLALAAVGPKKNALPIALFASTLRPTLGLVFALVLRNSALGSSPASAPTPAPTPGGTTTTGSTTKTPALAPKIIHLSSDGKELQIAGENFGRRKNAVTVKFSWPVGSPQMTTETMPLARHDSELEPDLITIPMRELPAAAARSKVAVVVTVNGVSSNSKDIDL
jgi:hypothetical protein